MVFPHCSAIYTCLCSSDIFLCCVNPPKRSPKPCSDKAPARLPEALPLITMCFTSMGVTRFHVTGIKWESHCQGNQKWEHVQFQPCPRTQINSVHSHCVLGFLVSHSQGGENRSMIVSAHPSPSTDVFSRPTALFRSLLTWPLPFLENSSAFSYVEFSSEIPLC